MAIGGQIGWIKSSELTLVFVFKRSLTALWNSFNALCNHRCKTRQSDLKQPTAILAKETRGLRRRENT